MSQLTSIVDRRRQALVQAWRSNPLQLVQAESPAVLGDLVYLPDGQGGGQANALGRRSPSKVAVVRRPGNPDSNASVWVAASYSGYQGAYLAFVNEVYGINATTADLAGYDVDHMLNRGRSPLDSTFIRIEAVPSNINQEWGRLFEKAASNPKFFANQKRERRTLSWVICAKLSGQSPPLGPKDTAGIDRLARFFATIGLPQAEAREGLQSMLSFAYS